MNNSLSKTQIASTLTTLIKRIKSEHLQPVLDLINCTNLTQLQPCLLQYLKNCNESEYKQLTNSIIDALHKPTKNKYEYIPN